MARLQKNLSWLLSSSRTQYSLPAETGCDAPFCNPSRSPCSRSTLIANNVCSVSIRNEQVKTSICCIKFDGKQMAKDESLNPCKPKISSKPVQNFVKCSHLNLPPFLCPRNYPALFVGCARTFIICRPTKRSLCFAYLRA